MVASSTGAAVEAKVKKHNKGYDNKNNKYKGKKKGFSEGKKGNKKEHRGATKTINGCVFVNTSEDPGVRQDNCRCTAEAIET